MQSEFKIRKATQDDIKEITESDRAIFKTENWSMGNVRHALENRFGENIVCVKNGKIAGYLLCMILGGDTVSVDRVAVLPEYRQKNIASEMMNFLFKDVNDKITSFILEVRESNKAAIGLYKKFGFTQNGIRPGYYKNPDDAALLFELDFEA